MIKDIFVPSKRDTFIPATVYCRDDAKGLLLQTHSFKSDRKEDGRYTAIAKAAYDTGLNVISMDFPGNGESKEDFISYSLLCSSTPDSSRTLNILSRTSFQIFCGFLFILECSHPRNTFPCSCTLFLMLFNGYFLSKAHL